VGIRGITVSSTNRFCLQCQKITVWKYKYIFGHSRCTECSGAFSTEKEISEDKIPVVANIIMKNYDKLK
jgi:hypothetical protein